MMKGRYAGGPELARFVQFQLWGFEGRGEVRRAMRMTRIGYGYDRTPYYHTRCYDPSIGRFVSEDPIGLLGGIKQVFLCL